MPDYAARCRELASTLRELGDLAEPVAVEATQTDVLCHDVLRLTEAAHAVAVELLRASQGTSPPEQGGREA